LGSGGYVTKKLAEFASKISFNELPRDVVEHAKLCILDWLGAALAGSASPVAKVIAAFVKGFEGVGKATVIRTSLKAHPAIAALANGVMGHAVEMDDIHREALIHPAAPVVPAALAVAEHEDVHGRDLIEAVVLGYEIEIRLGMAVNPSHYEYWHTTSTCGTFGAAVAAGKLLGLDEKGMAYALGIAGTSAAGLIEVFGTMSKPYNAGRAAMDGVLAAVLAKEGLTSSTAILESPKGFLRATSKRYDTDKIFDGLGVRFEIKNNIFKVHASCGHTHGAIDAVLEIVKRYGVGPSEVREILVGTYPIAVEVVGKNYEPRTPEEAKFSLPYCVAVAMLHGRAGLEEFSYDKLADDKVRELMKKVKVYADPDYSNCVLGCAKVKIVTRDGRVYEHKVDVPKGYPENPLTRQELLEKFEALASKAVSRERTKKIAEVVGRLEHERVRDVTALLSIE
jgi:2-methylcitrate dehydratase PrpD